MVFILACTGPCEKSTACCWSDKPSSLQTLWACWSYVQCVVIQAEQVSPGAAWKCWPCCTLAIYHSIFFWDKKKCGVCSSQQGLDRCIISTNSTWKTCPERFHVVKFFTTLVNAYYQSYSPIKLIISIAYYLQPSCMLQVFALILVRITVFLGLRSRECQSHL